MSYRKIDLYTIEQFIQFIKLFYENKRPMEHIYTILRDIFTI